MDNSKRPQTEKQDDDDQQSDEMRELEEFVKERLDFINYELEKRKRLDKRR